MFKKTLLFITFLLATHAVAHAQILVMGDSLSAAYGIDAQKGWVPMMKVSAAQCKPPQDVINASISGETTEGGLSRLPALLNEHQPHWVLIELGGNDALQGKSIESIENNLKQMIELSHDNGAQVLLMEMMVSPNYGPYYSKGLNAVFQRLGELNGVILMPFFLKDIGRDPDNMQPDLVHPNEKAQFEMFKIVWPYVKKELGC